MLLQLGTQRQSQKKIPAGRDIVRVRDWRTQIQRSSKNQPEHTEEWQPPKQTTIVINKLSVV